MICPNAEQTWIIDLVGLQRLMDEMAAQGWDVHGPKVVDETLRFGPVRKVQDLPIGWVDDQSPGRHLLHRSGSTVFGVVHGASSAKAALFPPKAPLWRARKVGATTQLEPVIEPPPRRALIGLRPCDIRAILIQDKVFLSGEHTDPAYRASRENTLLVAVNCARSQPTCFCSFMGGGTTCAKGHDILLTEFGEPAQFLVEAGSPAGWTIIECCGFARPSQAQVEEAYGLCEAAEQHQEHGIRTEGLKRDLYRAADHPRWQEAGARCFACTSCTQVCPTCFCHTPVDSSSLDGASASRERVWDSCFVEDFSHIHGGAIRRSVASRYRQWLTHKLAAWQDQFGVIGCVGCGRCITWCPAGIDLRDEAEAVRHKDLVTTS